MDRKGLAEPYVVKEGLEAFPKWDIAFFCKYYGEKSVLIFHSRDLENTVIDFELVRMSLYEYINSYLLEGKTEYYFKSEDSYQFLREIGFDFYVKYYFRDLVPLFSNIYTSFWMGPRGSFTSFHFDTDAVNFLCLLEGRKKICFVKSEFAHKIRTREGVDDCWADISSVMIQKMKDTNQICEFILKPGEIFNIPHKMWHSVENLDNTLSFTFHF